MRWKIKSQNTKIDNNLGIKTTTTTKQLVVTIGDAVGVGKTALDAIKAANKTLPALNKANPKAGLAPFVSGASILATVASGLEIYKKLSMVTETITPIAQLVARASGVWCSPGNAADIVQIVLGQVKKILVSLAISAVNTLKDYVWNYEFVLKEINEVFEETIQKNIQKLSDDINKKVIKNTISNLSENSKDDSAKKLLDGLDKNSGDISIADCFDWDDSANSKWNSDGYITHTGRLLRGSLRNLGIEYSDDNGETWNKSSQLDGSWNSFAKIIVNDEYIYLAGGIDYITSITETSDISWIPNKHYYYFDDFNYIEYSAVDKKNPINKAGEKYTFELSKGIYYSTDVGETWNICDCPINICVNDLCEFEEKDGSKATVVASSNNFDGCYYTENGVNWFSSNTTGKWLDVEAYDNIFKRVNSNAINIRNNIKFKNSFSGNYIQKHTINILPRTKITEIDMNSGFKKIKYNSEIQNEINNLQDPQDVVDYITELIERGGE